MKLTITYLSFENDNNKWKNLEITITAQCMHTSTCTFCTILYSLCICELTLYKVLVKIFVNLTVVLHIYTHSIFTIQDVAFSENKMKDIIFNAVCWYFLWRLATITSLLNFQFQFFYWHWSTSYKNMLHVLIYSHAIHMHIHGLYDNNSPLYIFDPWSKSFIFFTMFYESSLELYTGFDTWNQQ